MIDGKEIERIVKARLKDAKVLADARQYDGAIYLCGYAVELALKARICRVLKWAGFPSTRSEFKRYSTFRTHDLDVLLHLTGMEGRIKSELFAEWSVVVKWDPESRYSPIGSISSTDAKLMLSSVTSILAKL